MSVLRNLQISIANRLSSQPFLAGCPIVVETDKDILNQIQTALAKLGVCVIVSTPDSGVSSPNALYPYFSRINIVVRVVEMPTLNRGANGLGLTAYDVSEFCAVAIHQWSPLKENSSTIVDVDTTVVVDDIKTIPDKVYLVRDVRARTAMGIDSSLVLAPPNPVVNNVNPSIRFTNQGVLDIYDSGTSVWMDIGLQNGQLFLSPPDPVNDSGNIRFVGGSMQLLDDVLDVWMTVGASGGQLFVDPTNSPTISNVQFSGGSLQIYDSVLLKWMSLGVSGGQLFLS